MRSTKSPKEFPGAYVALLRGVNVGGKNKLPMSELVKIFLDGGCARAQSYIQSGNVIFVASQDCAAGIAAEACDRIFKRFGFRSPVIVRSAQELAKIVKASPFPNATAAGTLHVAFLADAPERGRGAALDPNRSPGDSFKLRGREIYLDLPNGVAGTRFTNDYLDRTLNTTSTLRNWRTVSQLLALAREST